MMQRRRYLQANPPAEQTDPGGEAAAHQTPIDDVEMQAAIADIMKEYLAARPTASTEAAASEATPAPAAPNNASPQPPRMINPIQPSVATAIHDSGPRISNRPPLASHKKELLQHSAMQRVVGQNGLQNPV